MLKARLQRPSAHACTRHCSHAAQHTRRASKLVMYTAEDGSADAHTWTAPAPLSGTAAVGPHGFAALSADYSSICTAGAARVHAIVMPSCRLSGVPVAGLEMMARCSHACAHVRTLRPRPEICGLQAPGIPVPGGQACASRRAPAAYSHTLRLHGVVSCAGWVVRALARPFLCEHGAWAAWRTHRTCVPAAVQVHRGRNMAHMRAQGPHGRCCSKCQLLVARAWSC